jgi:hypothetical protein
MSQSTMQAIELTPPSTFVSQPTVRDLVASGRHIRSAPAVALSGPIIAADRSISLLRLQPDLNQAADGFGASQRITTIRPAAAANAMRR